MRPDIEICTSVIDAMAHTFSKPYEKSSVIENTALPC